MNEALVSIVVPVYNQEKYLHRAIEALMKQTYSNIEIILVDDGSTDDSNEIMHNYLMKDKRIRLLKKENGGLVDATIFGIQTCKGKFICFMDPDDYIGKHYIANFIQNMEPDIDCVAAGFYYESMHSLLPYQLNENAVYDSKKLQRLKFLVDEKKPTISNLIFISRWNKMYRTTVIRKMIKEFEVCRGLSLGEDTIFTYLFLKHSKKIKAIRDPNSYFYNIGNQHSMMKSDEPIQYIQKCKTTLRIFSEILKQNNMEDYAAYYLYYFLVNNLLLRIREADDKIKKETYKIIFNDGKYRDCLKLISDNQRGFSKIRYKIMHSIKTGIQYNTMLNISDFVRKQKRNLKIRTKIIISFFKKISKKGIRKAFYETKFSKKRDTALQDLNRCIAILDERIKPIIMEFERKNAFPKDYHKEETKQNVFVFWWDGFESAPCIVKDCLASIKKCYSNYNIIEIDSKNYDKYTNINAFILKDFEAGKISIQTFSDILRFNLLKNNGGIWIDATIYFFKPFDLTSKLSNQSFNSLEFSSSKDFFQYCGLSCTWSGYFIASRKEGNFVNVVDYIFEKYYTKYRTYTTYFFIDAVLMLCKKYNVDNSVLDKTTYQDGNMFNLSALLNYPYCEDCLEFLSEVPQKLAWFQHITNEKNTFATILLGKGN